jgi:hypothetical protein
MTKIAGTVVILAGAIVFSTVMVLYTTRSWSSFTDIAPLGFLLG